MPYCPNCGKEVGEAHHYCGRCGYPLAEVNDEEDEIPPSGTSEGSRGFLSGRSVEYINDVRREGEELDPESVGYANLSRDVVAGLADFAIVSFAPDLNLFRLLSESTESGLGERDLDDLNRQQLDQRLAWIGLYQLPTLYDQTFGTDWWDELSERVSEILEVAENLAAEE